MPTWLAPLIFHKTEIKFPSLVKTSLALQLPPDVWSNLDSCSGAVVEWFMHTYVVHPTWMQMIFREPSANLNLIPGYALKPQGCCQRSLSFFAKSRKEVKAELQLWLKVLIVCCIYKRKSGARGRTRPSTSVSKGRNSARQSTRVPLRLQLKLPVIFSSSCKKIRA